MRVELLPPEVEREGLDAFEPIGSETREVIERRPASVVVVEVVKKKFVRKSEKKELSTAVLVAETPELPIPRGSAGPGMLADSVVKRWQDHLPLHRMESIYRREGIELNRSTVCGWHIELAELAEPLIAAMHADALAQPYVCVDATGVLVQDREQCRNGHFWVLVAPPKHVLFQFSDKHDSAAVDRLLPDYRGTVVADAHVVYDHIFAPEKANEAGCCMSWIFGLTGSMDYLEINRALAAGPESPLALFIAVVLTMTGFGYKIAAAPFHMWAPDVYTGAPIPITAFLSVGSKAGGFALLLRFFYPGLSSVVGDGEWEQRKLACRGGP